MLASEVICLSCDHCPARLLLGPGAHYDARVTCTSLWIAGVLGPPGMQPRCAETPL